MELKKTNHLLGSVETNVVNPSERNNSDKPSVYDITLSAKEDKAESTVDIDLSNINGEERRFSDVSTLDWLQTWRSTELS